MVNNPSKKGIKAGYLSWGYQKTMGPSWPATLGFSGFWGSLAPHLVGKYIIPGSLAPPISQGSQPLATSVDDFPSPSVLQVAIKASLGVWSDGGRAVGGSWCSK